MAEIQPDIRDEADAGGSLLSSSIPGGAETVLWTARIPLRSILPTILAAALASWVISSSSSWVVQTLVNATYPSWAWTEEGIISTWDWVRRAALIPPLLLIPVIIRLRSQSYTLTTQRLVYRHGIFVRTVDEIALFRIRDFRMIRTLRQMLLGLGTVRIISRDETWPEIDLGPISNPASRLDTIRSAVLEHQHARGYREFEAH